MAQQNADQAVHEAARAGLTDRLAEMLAMDPSLIDSKGMDARTPLHCAVGELVTRRLASDP